MELPLVAITMGDPTGVGPEAIVGAWTNEVVHSVCRPFVVGHSAVFRRAISLLGLSIDLYEIDSPDQAWSTPGRIACLRSGSDDAVAASVAQIDARGGQAAYDALTTAARLALDGQIDALTTAPLHKSALWAAGHHYPGHTELLAELCGVNDFAMMLYLAPGPVRSPAGLAIVHVTLHLALREAIRALDRPSIVSKCRLVHDVMRAIKGAAPRIGVCALNPHGGEGGLFGDEESTIIAPAVTDAQAAGILATGPYPADTLILRAREGEFDAVVAMYHDQGHIAVKLMAMHNAVNVTLGLPIVRTSVAHGTAFDLAWQGRAESSGMVEAIRVASRLASARRMARSDGPCKK